MRLLVALHGRTLYNVDKKFSGQVEDQLDEVGRQQALCLAERLSGEQLTMIASSPLSRAFYTAGTIAASHRMHTDRDLTEVGMGAWEGRVQKEVELEEPALFARWIADPENNYPEGGESLASVRNRVARALARAVAATRGEGTVLWVTHSVVIGVLMCYLLDVPLIQRRNFHTDNGSLSEWHFLRGSSGLVPVLHSFNDTSHTRAAGLWTPSPGSLYVK
jgi:broad specificity phosphatase PhoE